MNEEALTTEQETFYKICTLCKNKKLKTFFYFKAHSKVKLDSWCKPCKLKKQKASWSKNSISFVRRVYQMTRKRLKTEKKHELLITCSEFLDIWKEQHDKFGLRCPYSNLKMTHVLGNVARMYNISVDRIDSNKPYEDGNIVFCCAIVNRMKQELSVKDFYSICKSISKNNKVQY